MQIIVNGLDNKKELAARWEAVELYVQNKIKIQGNGRKKFKFSLQFCFTL